MDNEDTRTISNICLAKIHSTRSAVNWLVGLGIFFLVLGIILQVALGQWAYAGVWVFGIILLIVAAIVYAAGAPARDCYANPTNGYCRLLVIGG